jgi:hypothetical protein
LCADPETKNLAVVDPENKGLSKADPENKGFSSLNPLASLMGRETADVSASLNMTPEFGGCAVFRNFVLFLQFSKLGEFRCIWKWLELLYLAGPTLDKLLENPSVAAPWAFPED